MLERKLPVTSRRGMLAPFNTLREEMDRLFDDWMLGSETPSTEIHRFAPRIDVQENDKHFKLIAELPGVEEKDVDIELEPDRLVLEGKKLEDKEEKGEAFYRRERHFGSFHREIMLPWKVEPDKVKVDATYKNGVLTIMLPKPKEVLASRRRIPVKVN